MLQFYLCKFKTNLPKNVAWNHSKHLKISVNWKIKSKRIIFCIFVRLIPPCWWDTEWNWRLPCPSGGTSPRRASEIWRGDTQEPWAGPSCSCRRISGSATSGSSRGWQSSSPSHLRKPSTISKFKNLCKVGIRSQAPDSQNLMVNLSKT